MKSTYYPSSEVYFSHEDNCALVLTFVIYLLYEKAVYCVLIIQVYFTVRALAQPFPSACNGFSKRFPAPSLSARGFFLT